MSYEHVQAALKDFNVTVTKTENSITVALNKYEPDKERWSMINQICLGFGGKYEPQDKKPGLWRIPLEQPNSVKVLAERFDRVLAELASIRAEIETQLQKKQ